MRRQAIHRRAGAFAAIAACACVGLAAGSASAAEEPLVLLVEREALGVGGQECVIAALYVVRSADRLDAGRVRIGDAIEVLGASGKPLASGRYRGEASEGPDGWGIDVRVDEVTVQLRAPAHGVNGAALLLGRVRSAHDAACRLDPAPLEDGEAILRRLRQVYASPTGDRAIEVVLR